MQARPWSAAQRSSASALVPFMSDLKPPSQNSPGAAPSRIRTAIRRDAGPVPTSIDRRMLSLMPEVFRRKLLPDQVDGAGKALLCKSRANPAVFATYDVDIRPDNP